MDKTEQLIKVINFWQESALRNNLFKRNLVEKINLKDKEVIDILGARRVGKSSVLKLIIKELKNNNWLYINFEDPFFVKNRNSSIIEELTETYKNHFNSSLHYLFFDEIQSIKNWESVIRKFRDGTDYKIFITGSSSKMLSGELATLLSGRHFSYKLLPFSFKEYLEFKNILFEKQKDFVLNKEKIIKFFNNYLNIGGFPEIVITENKELLKQYFNDVVEKDIIARHNIKDREVLEKMAFFLLSNSAKIISIASLKKAYDISYQKTVNYLKYFKESFIIFDIPKFSYSLKEQQKSQKKIYSLDTGLSNNVAFKFSEDRGRVLENCVFLELKRKESDIYYFKNNVSEVDFVVKKSNGYVDLIQVVWDLNEDNKNRELNGFKEALKKIKKVENLIILTNDQDGELQLGKRKIQFKPVYKWLLSF